MKSIESIEVGDIFAENYGCNANFGVEINKMLTLSTCHITEETANRLSKDPDDNNLGLCVYPKAGYGYYIAVTDDITEENLPDDLKRVIRFAAFMDCQTLCLDCDGSVCDFLPTYDW